MASERESGPSLARLHEIEQSAHAHAVQRQSCQAQLADAENALKELAGGKAYRIVGAIMVEADPARLREELEEKRRSLESRVAALKRQEDRLREEMRQLQQDALKGG